MGSKGHPGRGEWGSSWQRLHSGHGGIWSRESRRGICNECSVSVSLLVQYCSLFLFSDGENQGNRILQEHYLWKCLRPSAPSHSSGGWCLHSKMACCFCTGQMGPFGKQEGIPDPGHSRVTMAAMPAVACALQRAAWGGSHPRGRLDQPSVPRHTGAHPECRLQMERHQRLLVSAS